MTNNIPKGLIKHPQKWLPGSGVRTFEDVMVYGAYYVVDMDGFNPHRRPGEAENVFTQSGMQKNYSRNEASSVQKQFFDCIRDNGASLLWAPGDKKLVDHIFTKDVGRTYAKPILGDKKGELFGVSLQVWNSNFFLERRQNETRHYNYALSRFKGFLQDEYNADKVDLSYKNFGCYSECGDTVYDMHNDWWYVGGIEKKQGVTPMDGRSDPEFHEHLAGAFNMAGRSTHLPVQNSDYHMDVTLACLPCGGAVINPHGLSVEDFNMLKSQIPEDRLIIVQPEDVSKFVANMMILNNKTIIMPESADKTKTQLEGLGYKVEQFDFSEFIDHAGGGPNCMNNNITFMRRDDYTAMLNHLERDAPSF